MIIFVLGIRKKNVRIWAELLEKHPTKSGKRVKETQLCKINYRGFRILWIAWDSKGKTNWFKKKGIGNGPKTADPIDDKEVENLYQKEQLGSTSPDAIINTIWWQFTIHYGMRGNMEHYYL